MKQTDSLYDPLRMISACRIDGVVHVTTEVNKHLKTLCGLDIDIDDLLILRQRIEDITCSKCKEHLKQSN